MAPAMAPVLEAEEAVSGHPHNGERPEPDELAEAIATMFVPEGMEPSRWQTDEFQSTVDQFMQQPPALLATAGGPGFTVEFPFANESSLCQVMANQPHPRYGNGLFLLQRFPYPASNDAEGASMALALNGSDLLVEPSGYGFGSYCYRKNTIHFTAFFPNAMYMKGLLPNIYYSCASRAEAVAVHLTGQNWTEESFDISHSSLGRAIRKKSTGSH